MKSPPACSDGDDQPAMPSMNKYSPFHSASEHFEPTSTRPASARAISPSQDSSCCTRCERPWGSSTAVQWDIMQHIGIWRVLHSIRIGCPTSYPCGPVSILISLPQTLGISPEKGGFYVFSTLDEIPATHPRFVREANQFLDLKAWNRIIASGLLKLLILYSDHYVD